MDDLDPFERSDALAEAIITVVAHPLFDDSPRIVVSDLLCSLALEHAHSTRLLLSQGLLPSALVVHRAQFEAVVRAVWTLYAASDGQVEKLATELTVDAEQAAKNLPSMTLMMEALAKKAPVNAYTPLHDFKTNNWPALNSYAHAGIHPIARHLEGYPVPLILGVLGNCNGMMVVTAMQSAVLTGIPNLQRRVLDTAGQFKDVLGPEKVAATA